MKKILLLIFFLTSSCGYQSLYSNKNLNNYSFNQIELLGNKDINRRVISATSIREDKNDYTYEKISIKSEKNIIETSKDSKGQPDSFKMMLKLDISIINNGKTLKERKFLEEFSYKNLDNKFDLSQYEIDVQNSLVDRIVEELIIYLSI